MNANKRFLKITVEDGEIWIRGNKEGLEYLSDCCVRIIGKHDPSGHFHFMPEMGNLAKGSIKTRIEFVNEVEHSA